jgi:hypothetical protein
LLEFRRRNLRQFVLVIDLLQLDAHLLLQLRQHHVLGQHLMILLGRDSYVIFAEQITSVSNVVVLILVSISVNSKALSY